MKMRNLLLLTAIVLFARASGSAQQTPPRPANPSSPVIVAPVPPASPMNFSFYFDGSNYLGIIPEEINRGNMSQYGLSAPRGVGISRVTEGGPAEKAGLKKGDVILQFDGEQVTTTRKLFRLIGEAAPEQTVRLTILRGGSEQQLSVTLGMREDAVRALGALTPQQRGILREMPRAPQVWNDAPQVFSYGFGGNRRVGITTTPLTKQLAEFFGVSGGQGLLVTSVTENSPASKGGLRAGDVITELNGEKIEDADDFIRALNRKDEGEVTLTIIRDKSQRTIKVTPEHRPAPTFKLSELQGSPVLGRVTITPPSITTLPESFRIEPIPTIEPHVMPRIMNLPSIKPSLIAPRFILAPDGEL